MDDCHYVLPGAEGEPVGLDILLPCRPAGSFPVVVFCSGLQGFRDPHTFDRLARWFTRQGLGFVRFGFPCDGTAPTMPPEGIGASGSHTFSGELDVLGQVINFILETSFPGSFRVDPGRLYVMGYSDGGGIAILKAAEDPRVKKLVTWAAVNDFGKFWKPDEIHRWKKEARVAVSGRRSIRQVPPGYRLYRDYESHLDRLYIPSAILKLEIPFLVVHGRDDETVCVRAAYEMNDWNKDCTTLCIVEGANHAFGAPHPGHGGGLPPHTLEALHKTLNFLLN